MDSKTIVLITGGNTGIGYETASVLAASSPNYHIIITSRSPAKGETAINTLRSKHPNGSFSVLPLDVTSESSVKSLYETISTTYPHLDVLINNAGIISHSPTLVGSLRETFETNTFGPALMTETFTPLLLKSKNARLIYVSSTLGSIAARTDTTSPYYPLPAQAYRMSKTALNMLAVCDVQALGPKGVKVWTYCPGYVVTNLSGTGEAGLEQRRKNGAGSPKDSAMGLLEIVEGVRDNDVGKFVNKGGLVDW